MRNIITEQLSKKIPVKFMTIVIIIFLLGAGYLTGLHLEMSKIRADGGYWGVNENNTEMVWKTLQ